MLSFVNIIQYLFCFYLFYWYKSVCAALQKKTEETCDGPEAVVRHSIVAPKLGTQANPIVIGDNSLGSVSNPFVIHVDESWCSHETDQLGSDAVTTPELRGTLTGENIAVKITLAQTSN